MNLLIFAIPDYVPRDVDREQTRASATATDRPTHDLDKVHIADDMPMTCNRIFRNSLLRGFCQVDSICRGATTARSRILGENCYQGVDLLGMIEEELTRRVLRQGG